MPRPRKPPETETLFDDDVEQIEVPPQNDKPSNDEMDDLRAAILLLIFAIVIAGWYGVDYMVGPHAHLHGKNIHPNALRQFARNSTAVVFGLTSFMILWQWVLMGWEAIRWHFIPNCVLMVLALAYSGLAAKRHHGKEAWIVFGISILIAASPLLKHGINVLAFVLQNPVETFRHFGGKK